METREIRRITRVLMIGILMGVAFHVRSAGASAQGDIDISIDKELMIRDLQVIEDPVRTNPQAGKKAVWTFKYLIEQMAGDIEPSDFVMNWLMQWTVDQDINGSHVPARSQIWDKVIQPWLVASGGKKL